MGSPSPSSAEGDERARVARALRRALAASHGSPVSAAEVLDHLQVDARGRPTALKVELLLEQAALDPTAAVTTHRSLGDPEPRYAVGRGGSGPSSGPATDAG